MRGYVRLQDTPLEDVTHIDGVDYRVIPNTNRRLACSSDGVFVGGFRKILIPRKQSSGYLWYSYRNADDKYRNMYAHRGVALVWLDNPGGLRYVNHLDGNKYHNSAVNLEWCTARHNNAHARQLGLIWNIPTKGQQGFQRGTNV